VIHLETYRKVSNTLFLIQVGKVYEAIQLLGSWCKDVVHSTKSPNEIFDILQSANAVILVSIILNCIKVSVTMNIATALWCSG
jgi:hypothetical protein